MEMYILNLANPGVFDKGDTLHVIAVPFINGNTENHGEINVTSNDPLKKNICNIIMSTKHFYCNISFPNAGNWTIVARYKAAILGPNHYLASKSLKVTISGHAPTTTTTQPQVTEQATITVFSSASYNQLVVTTYYPIEIATVEVAASPGVYYPGSGTVTFTDATGSQICVANVEVDFAPQCVGGGRSSPPPNPITAHYSGTDSGTNDGLGSWYAPSFATSYVNSQQCLTC